MLERRDGPRVETNTVQEYQLANGFRGVDREQLRDPAADIVRDHGGAPDPPPK